MVLKIINLNNVHTNSKIDKFFFYLKNVINIIYVILSKIKLKVVDKINGKQVYSI